MGGLRRYQECRKKQPAALPAFGRGLRQARREVGAAVAGRGRFAAQPQTIALYAAAPPKPPFGETCNGCGACCAAAPCPVSRFLLGHRLGPCPALQWEPTASRYHCGMVMAPQSFLRWIPRRLQGIAPRLFRRWIAAGKGCDFDAEIE